MRLTNGLGRQQEIGAAVGSGSRLYVYSIVCVAACAGLLFGFDIAVINGAIVFLRDQFRLTDFQTEVAAASLLVGCVLGASGAGMMSDRYGRKRTLFAAAVLFAVSSIAAALPNSLEQFIAARLLAGVATGTASMVTPMYIAENSPPSLRGSLVTLNQLAIVSGILLAYLVNWTLAVTGPNGWRWMFATAAAPAAALAIALLFVPESPRWLIKENRDAEALRILTRTSGRLYASQEADEIRRALREETGSMRELLRPGLRLPLIIAVTLAVLQQITGVNTVLYYGAILFREQVGERSAAGAIGMNVGIGLVNAIATLIAIAVIDRIGRKPLLLVSCAGMALSLTWMGIAFHFMPPPVIGVLVAIFCYVFSFAIGMGPGVWVLMSELFPTRVRGRAMAIATVSLWLGCLLLTSTFLTLVSAIGASGTFLLYAAISVFSFLFIWRVAPETKGRTLEEIDEFWKQPA
jgi:MFS transporter, SP family, arabinose:H+ symporter